MNWLDPTSWFPALLNVLANELANAYAELLVNIITLHTTVALPTIETLKNKWFLLGIGSTYGLATQVMSFVAIVIALYLIIKVRSNNGILIARAASNFVLLAIFAVLFYPVYSLLVNFAKSATQALYNLATGTENATAKMVVDMVSESVMPDNTFGKMVTALLASAFGGITLIEAFSLRILLYAILLFYPLLIVLRPVSQFARTAFNVSNGGIVTIVLAGPIMGLGFLFPALIGKNVPGGDLPIATFVFTIIGGLFAMVTPFILMWWTYNRSSEVFGKLDTTVGGGIDIQTMPPMTMDDMQKDLDETNNISFTQVATGAALTALATDDDIYGNMKQIAIDSASSAAVVSGHPYVAAGIKLADHTMKKMSESDSPDQPQAEGA
jgi:hypothetical protein